MMRYLNIVFVYLLLQTLTSCSNKPESKTNSSNFLKWFSGNYILKSNYGTYYENWSAVDSFNFAGLGYYMDITNSDTLFRQRMILTKRNNDVLMYFNVKNQNEDKDVEFRLTKHDGNVFVFENPFRDYPSVITYKLLSDTSINVVMIGFKNKEEKKEDFIITKVKTTEP